MAERGITRLSDIEYCEILLLTMKRKEKAICIKVKWIYFLN